MRNYTWLFPYSAERQYNALLKFYAQDCIDLVNATIANNLSWFKSLKNDDGEDFDLPTEEDQDSNLLDELIAALLLVLLLKQSDKKAFDAIGLAINSFNEVQFKKFVSAKMGVTPNLPGKKQADETALWVKQNFELMNSKIVEYLNNVKAIVRNQQSIDATATATRIVLDKQANTLDNRVDLIADTETGTLNAILQKSRLIEISAFSYIWTTQMDERVRPLHESRQGKQFSWLVMPSDGHPGMPIRCRCVATPILDFDFENQFPISGEKASELRAYQPGVGIRQRPERDKNYMALLMSGKLNPVEILSLNRNKSSAQSKINELMGAGRLTQTELQNILSKV